MNKHLLLTTSLLTLATCTVQVAIFWKKSVIIFQIFLHIKKKGKSYKRDYTNFDEEKLINDIKNLKLTENILKINDLNEK